MAVVESSLHKAQSLFDNKNFAGALEHADEALKADPNSVSAHYWAGKASFCLGNIKRGKAEYKLAIVQDSSSLAAWEGLAELQMANGEVGEAQQTFEQLLNLAVKNGNILKQREYLWRSAEAADRLGDFSEAEEHLKQLQEMDLTKEQYIESLCLLADIQVKIEEQRMEQNVHQQIAAQERNPSHLVRSVTSIRLGVDAERADEQESEEGLADTLKAIVKRTAPNPIYSKYHAQHLQRFLSKMGAYTPRSAIRQDKRAEALKECIRMISAPGGCCTVFPFEAAIWLLEEQEELFGNRKPVHKSSSMSCTNLHRLVSRGSKHNLARGPSKNNLFAPPSLGRASSNLQSMRQQLKTPSPQQLNWYRGDSIRGVDREFIYKVLREEEDAAAARAVSSAVEKTQTGLLPRRPAPRIKPRIVLL